MYTQPWNYSKHNSVIGHKIMVAEKSNPDIGLHVADHFYEVGIHICDHFSDVRIDASDDFLMLEFTSATTSITLE